MSNSDSFIDEVTEELQRNRMIGLWRRWGPVVIGGIVLIVAGSAVLEWQKQQTRAAAREAGGVLVAAKDSATDDGRRARFDEAAGMLEGGPQTVARLAAASAAAAQGDAASAAQDFDALAGTLDDPLLRDLAAFKAALVRLPSMTPDERADAMTPFVVETHPFRLLALEQRAVALFEAGDLDAARADLENAEADQMTSAQLRQRLAELRRVIGPAPASE